MTWRPAEGLAQVAPEAETTTDSKKETKPGQPPYKPPPKQIPAPDTFGPPPVVKASGKGPTQSEEQAVAFGSDLKTWCSSKPGDDKDSSGATAAECKKMDDELLLDYGGPYGCSNSEKIVCAWDKVYHVGIYWMYIYDLSLMTLKTSNLSPLATGSSPDTLIYLLRCSDYSCESGDIVAVDDDGNDDTPELRDSKIVYPPTQTGMYWLVVTDYYHGHEGYADVSIDVNGAGPVVNTHEIFGGYHVLWKEARAGDSLFVGKNNNGLGMQEPYKEYHDSTLFYFSTMYYDCDTGSCGKFMFDDDRHFGNTTMLLSKIDVQAAYAGTWGHVVTGVYGEEWAPFNPYYMNARLFHYRRHLNQGGQWTDGIQRDWDGDGLSGEIETQIGTCDLYTDAPAGGVGVQGYSCGDFADLVDSKVPDTWNPIDSDNDGLHDDWEVFSVAVACSQYPEGPYYNAGTCSPIYLHATPGCGTAYCASLDLSAYSDPDPAMYDIYYLNDYWRCTGSDCAGSHFLGTLEHSITSTQREKLPPLWTDDPLTCWDGNPPSPHCDDEERDIPYMARMHAYNGLPRDLADDAFGGEINFDGVTGTQAYYLSWFPAAQRYTSTFRYSLASHYGGGQASYAKPGRLHIWGNDGITAVIQNFSHESGHNLGEPDLPSVQIGSPACPEAYRRCDAGEAQQQNPVVPSIMNYRYQGGFLDRSSQPPTGAAGTGCNWENARFSKGLNNPDEQEWSLNESSLNESSDRNWNSVKLTQELFCFNDYNSCHFNDYNPHCDVGHCYSDWDALRTGGGQPPEPYPFDVSYGRLVDGGACDGDTLADRNEWLTFFAKGKEGLSSHGWLLIGIYMDTFNSATNSNIAGWSSSDVPITSTAILNDAFYPVNVCKDDMDCFPRRACVMDTCTQDLDCRNDKACLGGVCSCSNDEDCYSAWCVADTGRCATARGACECWENNQCNKAQGGYCHLAKSVCFSTWDANEWWHIGYRPFRESARFDGPGSSTSLQVHDVGPTSPLRTISTVFDEFSVEFDFRFDGFVPGQAEQVIVQSAAFDARIVYSVNGDELRFTLPGQTPLVFPDQGAGDHIDTYRWYHVVWTAGKDYNDHYADVVAWDLVTGWFDAGIPQSGCVYQTWAAELPDTGDVWFGYDGVTNATRFRGRLDNIVVRNYRFGTAAHPSYCVQQ